MRQASKRKSVSSKTREAKSDTKDKIEVVVKPSIIKPVQNKFVEKGKRWHPAFGSSKLEDRFAEEFLDKLGVKYERQFEAKDIGRFYDFFLPDENLLIEVDGSYFHSEGLTVEEMNPMQKKNKRVDLIKDQWALLHGIPLLRIWESEINKDPDSVMKKLQEKIRKIEDKASKTKRNKIVKEPKKKKEKK